MSTKSSERSRISRKTHFCFNYLCNGVDFSECVW